MTAAFQKDDDLCKKYAQFAAGLDRPHFMIIYWFLFGLNLVVLFVGSWAYIKGLAALDRYGPDSQKRVRILRKFVLVCGVCVLVSTVLVIMQAYALLALEFCDGENLMMLYWATWTMVQVGSLIAMMGIILSFGHTLKNRKHPPWGLALGTPVLVITGILHWIHGSVKKRVKQARKSNEGENIDTTMSDVTTIRGPDDDGSIHGEFIGFTVEGGPIIRFNDAIPSDLEANCEVLGYFDGDRPIVAYRKDVIRFISASGQEQEQEDGSPNPKLQQREQPSQGP